MSAPPVSVVIVSRGRAADLPLCLLGVSQLDYPAFEVVLVADAEGLAAAQTLPFFDALKVVRFDEANISAARNLGIAEAAGEIVAFIDDDAVPEPSWLAYLVQGFEQPDVAAVGGFVIGRNGISFQWKARSVDATGVAHALVVDEKNLSLPVPPAGHAVKTEGTNMALRRDVIAGLGGFDPGFRFFLDETDVNFQLMQAGHRTAISPLAQVHHGYKASATRRADRVPTDLFEIGASTAVFLRKHAAGDLFGDAIADARREQRARALRHMVSGALEPRDVVRLMAGFDRGVQDGMRRKIGGLEPLTIKAEAFRRFPVMENGQHAVLSGWRHAAGTLKKRAEALVRSGQRTTLFLWSLSPVRHKMRFTKEGYWLQSGGLFGASDRRQRAFTLASRKKRLNLELNRLAKLRMWHAE